MSFTCDVIHLGAGPCHACWSCLHNVIAEYRTENARLREALAEALREGFRHKLPIEVKERMRAALKETS